INDHLSLKSISALKTDQSLSVQGSYTDLVAGPTQAGVANPPGLIGIAASGGGAGSLLASVLIREYQLSQEFNLLDAVGPVSGVVGYYYFYDHERMDLKSLAVGGNAKTPSPTAGTYTYSVNYQPTLSNAVFISQTYKITPTLSINAGVRYTWERKTLDTLNLTTLYEPGAAPIYPAPGFVYSNLAPNSNPFVADLNQDAHATTPKIGVDWQATPDVLLYAWASEGYHSGGYSFSARSTIGAGYGPETLWAYEAGAKTDWFDRTLRVDVAAFRYIWAGLQFNALVSQTPSISTTSNAGRASLNGLEATVIWKPKAVPGLTLTGNTTLLSTRYDYFPKYAPPGGTPSIGLSPQCVTPNGLRCTVYNATGNKLINAPDVSLVTTAQQDIDLGSVGTAYVRGEWSYTSRTYFDPTNAPLLGQPPYSLFNASVGFQPARLAQWDFALWGKNLSNEKRNQGIAAGSIVATTPGDPLTFGVRIKYAY
ncbi:MAG TPA: TonB-dependent receptor, partial [Caulobacteraceae bacterium]|nr:TonB-dependent receptor [Caulobacteraceae bacterium]